jgi:hypothetical protein
VERYWSPSQVTTIEASSSLSKTPSGRIDLSASLTPCQPTKTKTEARRIPRTREAPAKEVRRILRLRGGGVRASLSNNSALRFWRGTHKAVLGFSQVGRQRLVSSCRVAHGCRAVVPRTRSWRKRSRGADTRVQYTQHRARHTCVPVPEHDGSNASPKAAKRCMKALRWAGLLARDAADV